LFVTQYFQSWPVLFGLSVGSVPVESLFSIMGLSGILLHVNLSPSIDQNLSAYRQGYLTEAALFKVTNDVYEAIDSWQSVIPSVLDQSATCDCIDYESMRFFSVALNIRLT
jgi:hypothetical protein